jgi:DNA-binding NarL/FixJ family response regulator
VEQRYYRTVTGVLLVDDSSAFVEAARLVLDATDGFELVATSSSGEEAAELAARHAPDLILLDLRTPWLDGAAFGRSIARSRPEAVIVLMSADRDAEVGAQPARWGAAAFLPKEQLSPRKLRELWEIHSPGAAAR